MTRQEFERLSLKEQIDFVLQSDLYKNVIRYNYDIIRRSHLDGYIDGYLDNSSDGWMSLKMSFDKLFATIEYSDAEYFYRDFGEDDWDEIREITRADLMDIITACQKMSEYMLFDDTDFDGLEGLL